MTKPHEETWEVFDTGSKCPAFAAVTGEHSRSVFESLSGDDDDIPRARLAAQAPAMARLLLSLEWSDRCAVNGAPCCRVCGNYEPKHHQGCELATVLRAAGVLP